MVAREPITAELPPDEPPQPGVPTLNLLEVGSWLDTSFWEVVVILVAVCAFTGWASWKIGGLEDRLAHVEHQKVTLVCHPIIGDTAGNRVCVTP